ncbi:hypothetical protein [Methylopila turkensis]|uniref:Uncharacterized protein n=1 Tax=Methylopila turkensis TaxID=1437816 RepID=A0A9W6N8L8_9HYPH|nr:hypothetical protein [Methylopila turkensis]GLK81655.1 hypothetical protein GCM10008174_33960 [Methylopila turkensis]
MLARIAARLIVAPLGFTLGLLAGMLALAIISANHFGDVALFPDEIVLLGVDMTIGAWTVILVLGPLVGAPAIVAVLIGEMFAIRSWAYYAIAGAVTAFAPWALLPSGVDGPLFTAADILACGFVGGLVHWLVAGRGAGLDAAAGAPADRPPSA